MPSLAIPIPVLTIGLLILSNVFMTFAWYGHLKFKNSLWWVAALASWGIALAEYLCQVPANRIGHNGGFSVAQLKILQEVITKKDFDLACWGLQFTPDDGTVLQIESFLRSTSASNRVGYKNASVDAAITELKKAATDDAKTAAFKKISEAWANDAPSVPIAHVEERVVWSPKVRGLSTTAQNQVVFTKAWAG